MVVRPVGSESAMCVLGLACLPCPCAGDEEEAKPGSSPVKKLSAAGNSSGRGVSRSQHGPWQGGGAGSGRGKQQQRQDDDMVSDAGTDV